MASFALPATFGGGDEVYQPVVDPSGDIYLSSYYGTARSTSSRPTGTLLWSVDPAVRATRRPSSRVGTGASFQLVVSLVQDTASSLVLNPSHRRGSRELSPRRRLRASYVTQEAGGDLLFSANGYVETLSPTGQVLVHFGSPNIEGNGQHTGSGTQFYYPAQAVQGPTAPSTRPIRSTRWRPPSPNGFLQGSTTLGGALDFGGWGFALVGSTFYFQSGPPFNGAADSISSFSLAPCRPILSASRRPANTLGWGAGLATPATGNYFAPGPPRPWTPPSTRGGPRTPPTCSCRTRWRTRPPSTPRPSRPRRSSRSRPRRLGLATIPLDPADRRHRRRVPTRSRPPCSNTPTITADHPRHHLHALHGGRPGRRPRLRHPALRASGSGGPADPRGVALNSQLGLTGSAQPHHHRLALAASRLQRLGPDGGDLRAVGDDVRHRPATDPYQAAYLADQDHVTYWIQVSGGEPMAMALVDSGLWQGDVAALVAHYATVPAGCGNCAPVTNWEPWNESNNTGWPNGATYATTVLAPFYAAVKSVEPGFGVDRHRRVRPSNRAVGWWQQLVAAGGLADMDVAAIHPYTGSNDSYEEDGMPAQVRQLQAIIGSQAAVVHRDRLVERRGLQLPQPGQQRGPVADLAEGARRAGRELLLRRGELGQRRRQSFSLIQAGQQRRLREAGGAGHHDHHRRAGRPALPVDARHRHPPGLPGRLRDHVGWHHRHGGGLDRRARR